MPEPVATTVGRPADADPAGALQRGAVWLRLAIGLLWAEAAALAAVVAVLVYADLTAAAAHTRDALLVTGYGVIMTAAFAGLGAALRARRAWARGPAIVLNMLLLPIGYTMLTGGLGGWGVPVMAAGLIGAGALLAPATRAALGLR